MPRSVGSGLSLAAAGLLLVVVMSADPGPQIAPVVLIAGLCQTAALLRDGRARPDVALRLGAAIWCLASALLAVLATMATIRFHGFDGLLIPGSAAAAFDAWGCCPSMKLPELALMTLFVFGQLSGAVILLQSSRRSRSN